MNKIQWGSLGIGMLVSGAYLTNRSSEIIMRGLTDPTGLGRYLYNIPGSILVFLGLAFICCAFYEERM